MIYGKKYIYECPWGTVQAEFKTFDALMLFLHAKYDGDPAVPPYYLNIEEGHGCCFGNMQVRYRDDDYMTEGTSL